MTNAKYYNLQDCAIEIPHREFLKCSTLDVRLKFGPDVDGLPKNGEEITVGSEENRETFTITHPVLAIRSIETQEIIYFPPFALYLAKSVTGEDVLLKAPDIQRLTDEEKQSRLIEAERQERMDQYLKTTDTAGTSSTLESLIDSTIQDCRQHGSKMLEEASMALMRLRLDHLPLTKWHYDLVIERGVVILDNRFPDDFGVPFFEYQEALGHCPGWKYDLDLLERRRHYFYG